MSNGPTKIDTVIAELQEIKAEQRAQGEKIYDMHGKVSKLEVKAGFFGVVGGAVVALFAYLKGHLG